MMSYYQYSIEEYIKQLLDEGDFEFENQAYTYSDVSLLARKTFIAAPKSSLDKASNSGYSDAGFSTSAQTLPMMTRPTRGMGRTREAHRSLDLQGPSSSGIEADCTIAFVDLSVISLANVKKLSPFSSWKRGLITASYNAVSKLIIAGYHFNIIHHLIIYVCE